MNNQYDLHNLKSKQPLERLGSAVFILGLILILFGAIVSFDPGIPVAVIEIFMKTDLKTDGHAWVKILIAPFMFVVKSGSITCGIGFLFTFLGLHWIQPELAAKREVIWIFLISAVVIIAALACIGTPFPPGQGEVTPTPSPSPPLQLPSTAVVEAGRYARSDHTQKFKHLQSYFKDYSIDYVDIATPFYIQHAEVTVGEMRAYQASTGRRVQGNWDKDDNGRLYSDNKPVEGISYQEAEKYAEWLSQNTPGWTFRLPTLDQWAAACLLYGENSPNTKSGQPSVAVVSGKPNHLLGNLREWSSSSCRHDKARRWVLGENYMTELNHAEKEGKCVEIGTAALQEWAGVGFRLVATQD